MDVTVVLCTYNRADLLRGAVASLVAQETGGTFTFEVVVVDDGSTDDTYMVVHELILSSNVPIRYLRTAGNGQAEATNLGIQASSAPWIALFDDDQLADRRWLKEMMATAARHCAVCVGSSRQLRFRQDPGLELGIICRQLLGEHLPYECERKYSGRVFPQGGCSLISREVFASGILFKQRFAYGGYDTDLFRSAQIAGLDSWYSPNAIVYHLIPPYRTSEGYFHWSSLRVGAHFAQMDADYEGTSRVVFNSIARIAQAAIINVPRCAAARAVGKSAQELDARCLLLRAYAYVRQTARLISPTVLPQSAFFKTLEFRSERTSPMARVSSAGSTA